MGKIARTTMQKWAMGQRLSCSVKCTGGRFLKRGFAVSTGVNNAIEKGLTGNEMLEIPNPPQKWRNDLGFIQ